MAKTSATSQVSRSNRWARSHGYAISLVFGVILLVASVILIAADRDANFLVAGGTVLLILGAMAGRLTHLKLGKEGVEADISDQDVADELRRAEAAIESDTGEDAPTIDPASVLETAADAVAAKSRSEKSQRLAELRYMTSPASLGAEAEEWVMALERAAGRHPQRQMDRGPGDIISPPRLIEIKVIRAKSVMPFVRLTEREAAEAEANPNFYLYVVEVQDSGPERYRLRVFGGGRLHRLLNAARKRTWLDVPTRSPEYQEARGEEGLAEDGSAEAMP